MKPKNVICLKDGITSLNDFGCNPGNILGNVPDNPEWNTNRARGLEKLIELVKAYPDEWGQFEVTYSDSLKRDVLNVVEKQNGIAYAFYVAYEQDGLAEANVPF